MVQAIEPGSYARPWSEEAEKEDPSLKPTIWVYLGDKRLPFWIDETTVQQAHLVRQVTGKPRMYWLDDVSDTRGHEIDSWAVLWWLTRMQNGEPTLTLFEVEDGLKVGADFGVSDYPTREAEEAALLGKPAPAEDEDEDESPEA